MLLPTGVRLNVESKDLKRMLRDMGYSEGAIKEILKWYEQNNTTPKWRD
jgi:uncharacterized protein Smg (DUF494 family)